MSDVTAFVRFATCAALYPGLAIIGIQLATERPDRIPAPLTAVYGRGLMTTALTTLIAVSRMRTAVAPDGRSRTNTVMDPSGQKTAAVLVFDRR